MRDDGRLRAGLDPHATYKLSRWPQSEREFPKHFRIATVMLKQAHLLDEIASESGAGVADVVQDHRPQRGDEVLSAPCGVD